MNSICYELLLVALGVLCSWFITHRYYRKSLEDQESAQSEQLIHLKSALEESNPNHEALLKQNFIDAAVDAWKRQGTAVHYLNSLTDLANEEKSEILRSAALRHKGREPKNNPYA